MVSEQQILERFIENGWATSIKDDNIYAHKQINECVVKVIVEIKPAYANKHEYIISVDDTDFVDSIHENIYRTMVPTTFGLRCYDHNVLSYIDNITESYDFRSDIYGFKLIRPDRSYDGENG